ncbi:MAG: transporter [Elusimicrobia bacterium]|nr:transporter [Elusimicrobiota bacterium]
MSPARLAGLLAALALVCPPLGATPPLESGDMPTADAGRAEFFLGTKYVKSGAVERSIPADELVLGLSEREELTAEVPYLSVDGHHGFGDITLGTKYMFNYNDKRDSGIAGSFEAKLDNGSRASGLGNGAVDYEARLRAQETWPKVTSYLNVAHTWVGQPVVNGRRQLRHNIRLVSVAQETLVAKNLRFITEMIWNNSDIPGEPHRLAANSGVRYALTRNIELHGTIGRSLRDANAGGPTYRAYAGVKFEFASLPPER